MAVRDDVRQLATKKAQKFTPDPNLTPVAPTATIGARNPDARKPNKGLKRFIVGPGGDYGDLADPMWWAKGLGAEAKKNFYDPSKRFAAAVDPGSGASVADRIAGVGEGVLYAADLVTPFVPEGTIVNSLRREAMERVLDDEVARYAASGGGAKYRGVLGVHGSPKDGLGEILPFMGSQAMPNERVAFAYGATDLLPSTGLSSATHSPTLAIPKMYAGMREAASATDIPTVYAARFPSKSALNPGDPFIRVFTEPGQVVASVPASSSSRRFTQAVTNVMTPKEKRQWMELRIKEQLARSQQRRNMQQMIRSGGDF